MSARARERRGAFALLRSRALALPRSSVKGVCMVQPELEVALAAARLAGEFLQEEYSRFQVIPNAPANITTSADRQSQEIILKHLHAAFPQDALCAEEQPPPLAGLLA